MPRAMWNGVVIADSQQTEVVEGNHYFPPQSIRAEYFRPSLTHTHCGWKGTASYYDLTVSGNDPRRGRCLVLFRSTPRRGEHQGVRGVLERREG